ncbi:MAG TPA: zf-HC2 domain-containing protein [Gaiellaceae bacterium]|nr:zf-HC2 domain-containing protein [Gaiellaceae bacterium]
MIFNRNRSLSCQELVELVTDYLEGALPRRERRLFEKHLTACDGCTTYLEQIRVTIALTGKLEPSSISPEAEAALLAAFGDWKRT